MTLAYRGSVTVPTSDAGAWVPDACTLPTVERPLRVAEFDDLFLSITDVERVGDTLTLRLAGGADVLASARDLARRESQCCSFFDFTVGPDGDSVLMTVAVGPAHANVLDGIERRARARLA